MNYIIVDSREKPQAIGGILRFFNSHGYEYEVSKLLFGDYMDYNNPSVVIDRKQCIGELAKNCTSEHDRFRRELERVKKVGAHLVILVEQNRYMDQGEWVHVEKIEDLSRWSSPYTVTTGLKVFRILDSWQKKYPISFVFCDKKSTGKAITDILYPFENQGLCNMCKKNVKSH